MPTCYHNAFLGFAVTWDDADDADAVGSYLTWTESSSVCGQDNDGGDIDDSNKGTAFLTDYDNLSLEDETGFCGYSYFLSTACLDSWDEQEDTW
eukprot:CAMPEP_0202958026 /NCGR_PEP_ID=MMETSP1396-20130829/2368_1 /ASSEMBLY_ACC=CAM_ASM_000872 /TAXON_ID= /ORGANISM="Pseudokeronopsis sp., Strain Brazil" /LENGTH=93 /DNA_ID=CAMNT_0049675819 /DNA_START=227 /DNA_END=505 /DNA_ORIENTATION=+